MNEVAIVCGNCGADIIASSYCPQCGADQRPDEERITHRKITSLLWAFALVIGYVLLSGAVNIPRGPLWSISWELIFFALVLCIAMVHRDKLRGSLSTSGITAKDMFLMLAIQAAITCGVLVISKIMVGHGIHVRDDLAEFRGHRFGWLLASLSVAVFPAITEELAFRGILFSQLEQLTTPMATIAVTGFLFAWTHFSFISLFWLVPAGIFFGWMRWRYKTIWYGVACHFAHNMTLVVLGFML